MTIFDIVFTNGKGNLYVNPFIPVLLSSRSTVRAITRSIFITNRGYSPFATR